MIVLGNSVSLNGVAGAATSITITVYGSSTVSSSENPKQLYQGQLPSSAGTLLTAGASEVITIKTILLANVTGVDVTGVKLMVGGTAATNIVSPTMAIPANGGVVYDGAIWNVSDGTGKLLRSITAGVNSVTNSQLAQAAAYTVKGNSTGSTANEVDISIGSAAMSALPNLSGTNTGDETAASIESKLGVSAGNVTALSNLSGTNTGDQTLPTDATIVTSDVTTNNVSTTKHGWAPKAVAPAAGQLNVLGIANAETAISNKTIIGSTVPSTQAFGDAAAHGTAVEAAAADHKHAMPAAPTATSVGLGNVTNNAQTQAAIVPNTTPSAGQILVGNAGGTAYAPVSLSGDATITSAGVATVSKINNTSLASLATGLLKNTTTTGVPSIAVSGTDVKTINGTSILGSGDIAVGGSLPANARGSLLNDGAGNNRWGASYGVKAAQSMRVYSHSWCDIPQNNAGNNSIISNDLLWHHRLAGALGIGKERLIQHAVNGSQATALDESQNWVRPIQGIIQSNPTSPGFPNVRWGGLFIDLSGINDLGNTTAALQAKTITDYGQALKARIAFHRAGDIFLCQSGGPWTTFGANLTNATSASAFTYGGAKQATVVDSAGSTTATFRIPAGYHGEAISFHTVATGSGTLVIQFGGTVVGTTGIVGTNVTLGGIAALAQAPYVVRFTPATNGLSPLNAGQTITVKLTTASGATWYLDGATIEAAKPSPFIAALVPKLPCTSYNWAFGDGVGNGTTTFTSAAGGQFSSTTDVGRALVDGGDGKIPANTTVSSVTNATTIVTNNTIASGSNIRATLARTINGYVNYSGNTNFSGATVANHTAADAAVDSLNTEIQNRVNEFGGGTGMCQTVDIGTALNQANSNYYTLWGPDGLHMNELGHEVMASAVLAELTTLKPEDSPILDLNSLEVAGGAARFPGPKRRYVRNGQVYAPEYASINASGTQVAAGQMWAIPFEVTEATIGFSTFRIEQTVAPGVATNTFRFGIYFDDNQQGYPDKLWLDAGTVTTGTGTGMTTLSNPTTRHPKYGIYWFVLKVEAVGTTASTLRFASGPSPLMPNWSASGGTTSNGYAWLLTGQAAGAFPKTYPSGGTLSATAPLIGVQLNVF